MDTQERRYAFVSLMRRHEMRLVRMALRNVDWCAGEDWGDIEEIEIDPPHDLKQCWTLDTEKYIVQCIAPTSNLTFEDFDLYYRCTGKPGCKCYYCWK